MNFAWIGNVFGFSNSKKDVFSTKRPSKSILKRDLITNKEPLQVFALKKFKITDLAIAVAPLSTEIVFAGSDDKDLHPGITGTGGMKKHILFPHHGFW